VMVGVEFLALKMALKEGMEVEMNGAQDLTIGPLHYKLSGPGHDYACARAHGHVCGRDHDVRASVLHEGGRENENVVYVPHTSGRGHDHAHGAHVRRLQAQQC
jgi:hypothetical protein